jgi:hypothetical protein
MLTTNRRYRGELTEIDELHPVLRKGAALRKLNLTQAFANSTACGLHKVAKWALDHQLSYRAAISIVLQALPDSRRAAIKFRMMEAELLTSGARCEGVECDFYPVLGALTTNRFLHIPGDNRRGPPRWARTKGSRKALDGEMLHGPDEVHFEMGALKASSWVSQANISRSMRSSRGHGRGRFFSRQDGEDSLFGGDKGWNETGEGPWNGIESDDESDVFPNISYLDAPLPCLDEQRWRCLMVAASLSRGETDQAVAIRDSITDLKGKDLEIDVLTARECAGWPHGDRWRTFVTF